MDQENGENYLSLNIITASRFHAEISFQDGLVRIKDLSSTNGTFVNNKRVEASTLSNGDLVSFGDPEMYHFVYQEGGSKSTASAAKVNYSFKLAEINEITIGRSEENNIPLFSEATASSFHATIYYSKQSWWVVDKGSTNGTWVNGALIKKRKLEPDDIIFIGSSLIRLFSNEDEVTLTVNKWNNSVHFECVGLDKVVAKDLRILDDINLSIEPGEFVGILGPSGAGKSSLLKALNGFLPPTEGVVLMNELAVFKSYDLCKNFIGYVPQDDVIYQELSVMETLKFVAKLRLSKDHEEEEIEALVFRALNNLRLDHVSNSKVSSLSGGQRKRVSVAAELLTEPALLFLDEPTSGLDPSTEDKLMRLLSEMSNSGTTILLTTHILYNLDLLDKVIIMARGKVVFYGTPGEARDFFKVKGVSVDNPIKIFDLLEGELDSDTGQTIAQNKPDTRVEIASKYSDLYKKSHEYTNHIANSFSSFAQKLADNNISQQGEYLSLLKNPLPAKKFKLKKLIPSWSELKVLTSRNISLKFSEPKKLYIYLLVPIVLGLITLSMSNPGFPSVEELQSSREAIAQQAESHNGSIDYQLKLLLSPLGAQDIRSGQELVYQMRHQTLANLPISISALLLLVMTAIFCGTLTACLEFSTEKSVYLRERMAGMKTTNYVLSKIPFLAILTLVQMIVLVLICSIDSSMRELNLISLILCLVLISWCALSLGLLVSALDPSSGQFSVVIAIAVILPQLILSGAMGPDFYAGMNSLSQLIAKLLPAKWGVELVLYNSFSDAPTLNWVGGFVRGTMGLNYDAAVYLRVFLIYFVQTTLYLTLAYYCLERRTSL